MHEQKAYPSSNPPEYQPVATDNAAPQRAKWDPRGWSTKSQVWAGIIAVGVLIAIICGGVYGSRNSKSGYPNYTKLTYAIEDRMEGEAFFDYFDYFDGEDPAEGFVTYVSEAVANSSQYNLTYASTTSAILRVDDGKSDSSKGRQSVRITSKKQYHTGLFVFDILHSPYGCSTWPAIWLADPSHWPANGEIDVVEAVEQGNTGGQVTLHTKNSCTMSGVKRHQYGGVLTKNCWNGTDDNAGCGVQGAPETYGQAFNDNGGGIYAMELRDAGIRVWFFNRTNIPGDITANNDSSPDPSTWGLPLADFPGTDCPISDHFKNQSLIANIDLCGQWAGSTKVYSDTYGCPGTCEDFVTGNATAFENAYWEWSSWRVYSATDA